MMGKLASWHGVPAYLLVALLAGFCVITIKWSVAGLVSMEAGYLLGRAQQDTQTGLLEKSRELQQRGLMLEPGSATNHWQMAKIGQLSSIRGGGDGGATLKHNREAIRLRPSWGDAWVNFALAKYNAGELDQEFLYAFKRAAITGAWEPSAQAVILHMGLVLWSKLPREYHGIIRQAAERGMVLQSPVTISTMIQFKRFDLLCRDLSVVPISYQRYCTANDQ